MLKGLALTPPTLGRISIGKIVELKGKNIPQKDDEFTITSLIQKQGEWVNHPADAKLRKEGHKLRSIPVRLLFNDPKLNFRANYSMFDRKTGRPICVGDGNTCKRATVDGIQSYGCPSPDMCKIGAEGGCKPFGRLNVRIDTNEDQADELGGHTFRTTGFNSIRTLSTRLVYLDAVSGGKLLSALPLELTLRGKSTTQSHRAPVYYVDLVIRSGMTMAKAIQLAKEVQAQRLAAGFCQDALDDAARAGFAHGEFEESSEEMDGILPEFYPEGDAGNPTGAGDAGQDAPPPDEPVQPPSLPPYSDADIKKNTASWSAAFACKRKTPQDMIDAISTKYTLTEEQKQTIIKMAPTTNA